MAATIYALNRVSKVLPPSRTLLKEISLSFLEGAKIGVVGLNGAGKSTLLRIIGGEDKEFHGEAESRKGLKIGYLAQEPKLTPNATVRDNIEESVQETRKLLDDFDAISLRFGEEMSDDEMNRLLEKQANLQAKIDAVNAWELDRQLEIAADALRLPEWDAAVDSLSGGEKRRVALCKLLLSQPDMLILDEPTNHLDAESVAWLETYLQQFKGTVILVTHDRYFLDNIVSWILEIDRGMAFPFSGNYSQWLAQKEERLKIEEKQEEAKKRTMKAELDWIRTNTKGQQKKGKARLERYEELASDEFQRRNETNEIFIPPGPRLGEQVIEVTNLAKGFGDTLLFENLNFKLQRGSILGIIGPNGAGKSTLFKLLTGALEPDAGTVSIGDTVKLSHVGQFRDELQPNATVWEVISDGLDEITVGQFQFPSRNYVGRFNFKGQDQQKPVCKLSGGERNRVHLAKLLRSGGNVLLLDEPTNDLDVETLRALEQAILAFPGVIVVISHDRWFLDRVATHLLCFHGDSEVEFFEGNYSEYEAHRKATLGESVLPTRNKFKKFAH